MKCPIANPTCPINDGSAPSNRSCPCDSCTYRGKKSFASTVVAISVCISIATAGYFAFKSQINSIFVKSNPENLVSPVDKSNAKDKATRSTNERNRVLTIGVLILDKERDTLSYNRLKEYLYRNHPEYSFKLDLINITNENSIKDATEKLEKREWDIAFAADPFTSIAAIDNGYIFFARMATESPLLQTAIVVKKTSDIKSIKGITNTSNTKIGTGDLNSSTLYYMPLFDLYGARFIRVQVEPSEALESLYRSKDPLDVVAVLYSAGSKNKLIQKSTKEINIGDKYTVISLSQPIPSGSVYLSSRLEIDKRRDIEKSLSDYLTTISQEDREYETNRKEENYDYFRNIKKRVDALKKCNNIDEKQDYYDFTIKPCPQTISGEIIALRSVDSKDFMDIHIELTVRERDTNYAVRIRKNDLIKKMANVLDLSEKIIEQNLHSKVGKLRVDMQNVIAQDAPDGTQRFNFIDIDSEAYKGYKNNLDDFKLLETNLKK
jgi:ABC-type phosphate/phosphonate transport system substrate-binding protein